MSVIRISADKLPAALKRRQAADARAFSTAALASAHRLRAHLINETDSAEITDRGIYKNAFRVEKTGKGAQVTNDAPYAGVIELGARPHKVSAEGFESIKSWVKRKLLGGFSKWGKGKGRKRDASGRYQSTASASDFDADAEAITRAIVKKIERVGQKGHHIFGKSMDAARDMYRGELERLLNRNARRGAL